MARRVRISINLGISSSFIILVLAMAISLCLVIFISLKSILRDDLRTAVRNAVSNGVHLVDGDKMKLVQTEGDMSGDNYKSIQSNLQKIKDSTQGVRFVYTMRSGQEGIIFVVDAEPDDSDDKSPVGEVYEEATPELKAALSGKGSVQIESETHPDTYGTWLSGYAPIYDSENNLVGILGMDVSADTIAKNETAAFWLLVAVSGIVGVVVLFIGIIVSRRITTPLRLMERDMARISSFDLEGKVNVKSVFEEINSMAGVINDVKASLRSFKKYVPADLVSNLITGHGEASLGGQMKELSILFSDIEGFTTWAEKLSPEELVKALSKYFGGMTEIIMLNHGTVDKYIGDAIMAFWGAPQDLEDHAYWACKAAVECVAFQKELNEAYAKEGLPPLNTRFGINTGEVMVGNVGYENRFNYTVLGDHVNLASRLEGLNKMYGSSIIVSEHTGNLVSGKFNLRVLDRVVVKGKTSAIEVLALYPSSSGEVKISPEDEAYVMQANEGMKLYFAHKWSEALETFRELQSKRPADKSTAMLIKRCEEFKINDPGPAWKGAIVLREK